MPESGGQPAVIAAHRSSSNHRAEVLASVVCGCFYCCRVFLPAAIEDWVDEPFDGADGRTALCPHCGIDAVVGSASGYRVDDVEFLRAMRRHWF